jgi:hypothetical protein
MDTVICCVFVALFVFLILLILLPAQDDISLIRFSLDAPAPQVGCCGFAVLFFIGVCLLSLFELVFVSQ